MSAPTRRIRIAVLAAPPANADERRLASLLARMIQWAGRRGDRDVEAVLALDEAACGSEAELARARADGTPARPTRWRLEPSVTPVTDGGKRDVLVPADGGNDFLDCDAWLIVGAHPDVALRPMRPHAVVVSDCAYRYHPELLRAEVWDRLERDGCALLRHADLVLVHDPRTEVDVRSFAGVPRSRTRILPSALPGEDPPPGERPCAEDYLLWLPGPTACERPAMVLRELRHYYEQRGGRLRTVIAGEPDLEMHPSLEEHVVLAGELSPGARLVALQQARVLLHPRESVWPGLAPLDAAWLRIPILAARDAAMVELDRSLGLGVTFFDAGIEGDLASVLAELDGSGPRALPSREALASRLWWISAPALVDTLTDRLADRIPYAYR